MRYLICYDIVDDRRRSKLAKFLLDYGQRVQYSVFECDLTKKVLDVVIEGIIKCVSDDEDNVRVYRLCAECVASVQVFGPQRAAQTLAAVVV